MDDGYRSSGAEHVIHIRDSGCGSLEAVSECLRRAISQRVDAVYFVDARSNVDCGSIASGFLSRGSSAVLISEYQLDGVEPIVEGSRLIGFDVSETPKPGDPGQAVAARILYQDLKLLERGLKDRQSREREKEHGAFTALLTAAINVGVELTVEDLFPWDGVSSVSARELLLRRSVRGHDGLISTVALRPVSRRMTSVAARLKITPNTLTVGSCLFAFGAAALIAAGGAIAYFFAAVFMYVSLVLDCSDGELARFTGSSSALGAWLDAFTDRIKEHVLLIALALGAASRSEPSWVLAGLAVTAITLRHLSSFAFIDVYLDAVRSLSQVAGSQRVLEDIGGRNWQARPGLRQTTLRGWISRVLHAPVSERWALIGLALLVGGPRSALISYVLYVGLSLWLTLCGWLLRTAAHNVKFNREASVEIARIRDARVLARGVNNKWIWISAPLSMVLEASVLIVLSFATHKIESYGGATVFGVLVAVSWLRYERAMGSKFGSPDRVSRQGGGWLMRTALWLLVLTVVLVWPAVSLTACWILSIAALWLLIVMTTSATRTYAGLKRTMELS